MDVGISLADRGLAQRTGDGRSHLRPGIAEHPEQVHGEHPGDGIGTAQPYGREVVRGVGPIGRLVQQIPHGVHVTLLRCHTYALQRPVELRRYLVRRRQATASARTATAGGTTAGKYSLHCGIVPRVASASCRND